MIRLPRNAAFGPNALEDPRRGRRVERDAHERAPDLRSPRGRRPASVSVRFPLKLPLTLPHTEIDLITSQRSSQSNTAVLYLLMPTAKNVDLILSDFNPNPLNSVKSNKKTKDAPPPSSPKYSQAHVHFLDGVSYHFETATNVVFIPPPRYPRRSRHEAHQRTGARLPTSSPGVKRQFPWSVVSHAPHDFISLRRS